MIQQSNKNLYYAVNGKKKDLFRRLVIAIVGFLAKVFFRPQYYNQHYLLEEKSYMLLGNHHSLLDPVLVHLGVPDYVYWVAKKELFEKRLFSKIFLALKMIPLDRDKVDLNAMRIIRSHIMGKKIIGLFPQGTRVKRDKYQASKAQAGVASICLKYDCKIIPFYCDGPYKLFRKNTIVFGAPFSLNKSLAFASKQERKQELANEILRNSYALNGKPYL